MRYADAMAEALAELRGWEQRRGCGSTRCRCGRRATQGGECAPCRAARSPLATTPCACGAPYFADGKCQRCYHRAYYRASDGAARRRRYPNRCTGAARARMQRMRAMTTPHVGATP